MKVLFIQCEPPQETQDFNFPIGYACLAAVLERGGHQTQTLYTVAYHLTDEDIAKAVRDSEASVFAIGGMFPYLKRIEHLVHMIKAIRPGAKVVIGGSAVTYCPELAMRKTGADFGIRGEGEVALLKLIDALDGGQDYSKIPGLCYWQDGHLLDNGLGELMPLEEIPLPIWEKIPMEYYMRTGWYFAPFTKGHDRIISWLASRGCPMKCNFCSSGVTPRYKRVQQVVDELMEIKQRFHPTFLYMTDNLTMGNRRYCKELFEGFINAKLNLPMHITGRVDIVTKDLLGLLNEAGVKYIFYGVECANDEILKWMGKNITVDQIIEAIRLTKEAEIFPMVSIMFGQPQETLKDFAKSLKIVMLTSDRSWPFSNNAGVNPLLTFPGTRIYQWAIQNGYIKDDEDYYNQYFTHGWINYTRYPREVVQKACEIGNLLTSWIYHRSAAKHIEDRIESISLARGSLYPEESLTEVYNRIANLVANRLSGKRVVLYGLSQLADLVALEIMKRPDTRLCGFADGRRHGERYINGQVIKRIEQIGLEEYDVVLVCAKSQKAIDQICARLEYLKAQHGKELVVLQHELHDVAVNSEAEREFKEFLDEIHHIFL